MVNLTADTLKRHNVGTKFNAAMRGTCTDVLFLPSVTSSMAHISSDSGDLPHWLEKDETWSVEIGPWNSVGGYIQFWRYVHDARICLENKRIMYHWVGY